MNTQTSIRDEIRIGCIRNKVTLSELADKLNLDRTAISQWFRRGRIPPEHVLAIEKYTGVPREVLRPDIYPRERRQRA